MIPSPKPLGYSQLALLIRKVEKEKKKRPGSNVQRFRGHANEKACSTPEVDLQEREKRKISAERGGKRAEGMGHELQGLLVLGGGLGGRENLRGDGFFKGETDGWSRVGG